MGPYGVQEGSRKDPKGFRKVPEGSRKGPKGSRKDPKGPKGSPKGPKGPKGDRNEGFLARSGFARSRRGFFFREKSDSGFFGTL